MKIFQSALFRAVCAIAVGLLIIRFPEDGVTWLTVAIGVLFLLSGVISVVAYFSARRHAGEYTITDSQGRIVSGEQPTFPIVGAGSVILGLLLALTPGVFINGLMYILGAIMVLGGINQLMSLVSARRYGSVPLGFWIAPSLVLLTGLFVILKPMESASLPLLILGWCSLVYGVTELINAFKIHRLQKKAEQQLAARRENEETVAEELSSEILQETDALPVNDSARNDGSADVKEDAKDDYPDFIG